VPLSDYGVGIFTGWSLSPSNAYQDAIVQNLGDLEVPGSEDYASPPRVNKLMVKNGKIHAGHENQES